MALPREPQLPTFKVPEGPVEKSQPEEKDEDVSAPDRSTEPQAPSLTDISGIGPVYATRLASAGIHSIQQLADADAEKVAEARRRALDPGREVGGGGPQRLGLISPRGCARRR